MVHDVGISDMGCILVCCRRISTSRSQIPCDSTRLGSFTVFACLSVPVSTDVARTRFDKPAWDASRAFCQHIRSWLYWVVVTRQDVRSTRTTLRADPIAMLVVV